MAKMVRLFKERPKMGLSLAYFATSVLLNLQSKIDELTSKEVMQKLIKEMSISLILKYKSSKSVEIVELGGKLLECLVQRYDFGTPQSDKFCFAIELLCLLSPSDAGLKN